jgi:membrane associated rhomboid family serine protease
MATCYRHPDRETGVSCSRCERPICPDCMTPTPVGMRCPECSKDRTKVRTVRSLGTDPVVTYVLIAINAVVWLAELATGAGGGRGGGLLFEWGALYGPAVGAGQYWRLVSSAFLHANQLPFGLLHIGFNMYILYFLGQLMESSIGRMKFVAIYFTALLSGSFGALLLSPLSPTVGASGAVFGLMGAAVVVMRARGIDPWQSGIGPLILLNLLLTLTVANISIGGHIGGLIGGAAAAYLLVDLGARRPSSPLPLVACGVLVVLVVAGSIRVAALA